MATFSEIMADKNKLEQLKSALKEAEQDYQRAIPSVTKKLKQSEKR